MFAQLITILAWLAIPTLLIAIVDDWFLRPRRRLGGASGALPADPSLIAAVYYLLPVLLIAGIVHLLGSERLDFSLLLFAVVVLAGLIWGLDVWVFAPRRRRAAAAGSAIPEPVTVDYARSFFPVALIV